MSAETSMAGTGFRVFLYPDKLRNSDTHVIAIGATLIMAMPPTLAKNLFARTPLSDSARYYLLDCDIRRSLIVFWKIARVITNLRTSN
jgi:hypothetical protein